MMSRRGRPRGASGPASVSVSDRAEIPPATQTLKHTMNHVEPAIFTEPSAGSLHLSGSCLERLSGWKLSVIRAGKDILEREKGEVTTLLHEYKIHLENGELDLFKKLDMITELASIVKA